MAEMPMAPTDDSPMPGEAAPTQPGAGGTVIEILCKPDGSYEVSSEPAEAEMGEGAASRRVRKRRPRAKLSSWCWA